MEDYYNGWHYLELTILSVSSLIILAGLIWVLVWAVTILYGMILNFKDDTRGFFQVLKKRKNKK
jgi:uncharacterized protein HemY